MLCEWMAKKHVESVLQGRYKIGDKNDKPDRFAHRMWCVLYEKQKLDEKQLQELAMVPQKVVRVLLYRLLKDNLVSIQEVPKSKERTQARQKLFYWTVDLRLARLQLAKDASRSIRNLLICRENLLRGACPHKQFSKALLNAQDDFPCSDDPETQQELLEGLRLKEKRIEQTILRLDRALIHLTSFVDHGPW
jgi:DNA-directed RNA polymerase III subunit RPC3